MLAYLDRSTHTLSVTATQDGAPLNGASVTAVIVTLNGNRITAGGSTLSTLSLAEDGSTGVYEVTVPHNLDVTLGQRLRAQVTATKGSVVRYSAPMIRVRRDAD